jgi:hypothetical protein
MCKLYFNRGFAIMLVLMMLFLLFMLGVAFFFSAWSHAFMARNYLNMKRAFVVAEGGVQTAIGAIIGDFTWAMHAQNKPVDYNWRYWGNDPHEDRTSEDCAREARGVPVEYALNPSYALLDEDGKPRKITIFGKEVGLSGVMEGGAYGINSDIYHLKVMECSAQLYINEGLGHPYNTAVMQRILNNLGKQLELDIDDLGTRIMEKRPAHGYSLKSELLTLDVLTREEYDTVKDFLCTHTWSDPKVCNPVPLSWEARDAYEPELYQTRPRLPDGSVLTRYGRGKINEFGVKMFDYTFSYPLNDQPLTFGSACYSWQELNPCWIELTRRAPININTAPREILVALLEGLQGFFVLEQLRRARTNYCELETSGFLYPSAGGEAKKGLGSMMRLYPRGGEIGVIFRTTPISQENAGQIADAIIRRCSSRPFMTWEDFNTFINSLVGTLISDPRSPSELCYLHEAGYDLAVWDRYPYYAALAIADTIKANFNPNLHLNELNPDANLWQWVDKTDLIKNSTEFCFLPTGYFEIESVGQILRAEWERGKFHISPYLLIMKDSFTHNNQIMGQRRLKVKVKLWELYRETNQKDFIAGNYSRNNSQYRTNLNLACQSGPEVNNGYAGFQNNFEGYVMLSTHGGSMTQNDKWIKGRLYRTVPDSEAGDTTTMHAHYDFDFSLHKSSSGSHDPLSNPYYGVPDKTEGDRANKYVSPYCLTYDPAEYRVCRGYRLPIASAIPPLTSPSDQRIDGFYSERFAQLPYDPRGNVDSLKGTVSFWVKPGFFPELSGYIKWFWSINKGNTVEPKLGLFFGWYHVEDTAYIGYKQSWPRLHSMMLWLDRQLDESGLGFSISNLVGTRSWGLGRFAINTPTLNHVWHKGEDWWPGKGNTCPNPTHNYFLAHRWMHVISSWINEPGIHSGYVKPQMAGSILINGKELEGTLIYQDTPFSRTFAPDFTVDGRTEKLNPFWFGGNRWARSPACSTLDELHVWDTTGLRWITLWKKCSCFIWYPECKTECACPSDYKCKGGKEVPCFWCTKVYKCKGGSEQPCNCPSWKKCKGGTGSCYCSRWRKCRGGTIRGCSRYRRYTCKGCNGCNMWNCGSGCLCGGDGLTECSYGCKCKGTGKMGCLAKCTCDNTGKRCRQLCGCKDGLIEVQELRATPPVEAVNKWRQGRYYRQNDAEFISQEIDPTGMVQRVTAAPNPALDPYGGQRWKGGEGVTADKATAWLAQRWYHPRVKILGLSWTGYTDGIQDYSDLVPILLSPQLEVSLEAKDKDGRWVQVAGPFLNLDAGWAPLMVKIPSDKIRYRVRFNTRCDPANAVLLETLILDDVTIYYMTRPQWVSWVESY